MSRSRLDLSGFEETPPAKDPAVLRQISDDAGFPSRPAAPPIVSAPDAGLRSTHSQASTMPVTFHRPTRPSGNRHIPMNVRVDPETADRMYALRDSDLSRKRTLADVVEEAVALLYEREQPMVR